VAKRLVCAMHVLVFEGGHHALAMSMDSSGVRTLLFLMALNLFWKLLIDGVAYLQVEGA
jgi:hypothetical protein